MYFLRELVCTYRIDSSGLVFHGGDRDIAGIDLFLVNYRPILSGIKRRVLPRFHFAFLL